MKLKKAADLYNKFILKLERVLGKKPSIFQICFYALFCAKDYILYGSSISDFFELGFYRLKARDKKTYLTCRFYQKFYHLFDSDDYIWDYNKKSYQYQCLKNYMGREQLFSEQLSEEDFRSFLLRHPVFMYKPDQNECGNGVERIDSSKYDFHNLYSYVTKEPAVIDEVIVQHPDLESFSPNSVNTLRIVTAKVDHEVTIIAAALRLGSGNSVVDNFSAGGYVGAVNLKTGRIIADGVDHCGKIYSVHPVSHVQFKGFQIPNWDKVIDLLQSCAADYRVNFVGWDVAVRAHDAVIVEANIIPMIHVFQIAGNGGKKEIFKELYQKKQLLGGQK